MIRYFLLGVLLTFTTQTVSADEYSPAYLELKQSSSDVFDMLWKVPSRDGNKRLRLHVKFLEGVKIHKPVNGYFIGGGFIERSAIKHQNDLIGASIMIEGLSSLPTEVLVRIERLDGTTEVARLTSSNPAFVVSGTPGFWDVATTYLKFGVEHIWQGTDHLLFVACLLFIAGTARRILITITGFTIAHSITLSLAALDWVHIAVPPVEATIALSIVFLAREIILKRQDTLTWRYPIAVSASFGLLHGFGFASALGDIGLPQTEIPAALIAFNVGVEIGQILFVALILLTIWLLARIQQASSIKFDTLLRKSETIITYGVGSVAMMWTMERVMQFWL